MKAPFAGSTTRRIAAWDREGAALRSSSHGRDGSGAPWRGRLPLVLALLALVASLTLAPLAGAAPKTEGSGIKDYWGNSSGGNQAIGGKFHGNSPRGVAVNDTTGDVYVADNANHRIQQFDEDGNFIRAWGQDVIVATAGTPNAKGNGFEICDTTTTPPNTAVQCKAGITSAATGGALKEPAGIAINQANGDVYVSDRGNFRIQQFDEDGNFIRAWGQDVIVATGPPPNSKGTGFEVCDATTSPANTAAQCKAGVSTGTLGGTLNLPSPSGTAFHADLTIAPSGAPNAGDVLVTDPTAARVQEFTANGAFRRAFGFDVVQPMQTGAGASNINERQTVALEAATTGFTLTFGSSGTVTTAGLASNATAAEVEAALGSLTAIGGESNVDVSGGAGGPWTVEFTGALADTNVARIALTPTGFVAGTEVGCSSVTPSDITDYQWYSDGVPAPGTGTATATYIVDASDAGKVIQCRITKSYSANGAGATVMAKSVAVPAGSPVPPPPTGEFGEFEGLSPPSLSGSGTVAGESLTCNVGTWGNSPSAYIYTWVRNGSQVLETETKAATTDAYTLTAADIASAANLQCLVTAVNVNGKVSRASQNRLIGGVPNPAPPGGGLLPRSSTAPLGAALSTVQEGSLAFEVCTVLAQCQGGVTGAGSGQFAGAAVRGIAEDKDGNIYTVEARYNVPAGTSNFRVQKFTLPGDVVTPQGVFACAALCGTNSLETVVARGKDNPQDVAVDGSGYVYVTKAFQPGTSSGEKDPLGDPLDPPVLLVQGSAHQERVLKVDPATGKVVRVFLANPGRFNKDSPADMKPLHGSFGLTGLAVRQSGLPLYVVENPVGGTASSFSRVYQVDEIAGLTATLSSSDESASSATLEATITPASTRLDTFYRFEYSRAGADDWSEFRVPAATSIDDVGLNIGNGSDGGEASNCSPNLGKNAAICHVSQAIAGLERNRVYEFRLVASTEANGLVYTSDPAQFETAPSAPALSTGAAVWSGPPATGPSLTFNGQVNPSGEQTAFSFEYGTQGPCSANPCQQAPPFPRDVGHGTVAIDVNATVAGLDPSATYHYRIAATNSRGTSFGADRVVSPPSPTDRFIELVSDGESHGTGVFPTFRLAVSDDGERAVFSALAFGQQESSPSLTSPNIAQRGASGWDVTSMAPDPAVPTIFRGDDEGAVSAEIDRVLWADQPSLGSYRFNAKRLDGGYAPVSQLLTPLQRQGPEQSRFVLRGASLDQSTIVFASNGAGSAGKAFLADEPLVTGGAGRFANLYAIHGAGGPSPALSVVNRGADGKVIGGACGARLGAMLTGDSAHEAESTRAVSADGSTIYFSARPGNPSACTNAGPGFLELNNPVRIYRRVDDTTTVEVSACAKTPPASCGSYPFSGDDFFSGASADGSRAFFASPRQLTDSDGDTPASCTGSPGLSGGCDLYLYDADRPASERLTEASAGPNANVLGVLDVSMDGSRAYFAAEGLLTGANSRGASPQAGKANLYVFQRQAGGPDRIEFVASLSARPVSGQSDRPDLDLWSRKNRNVRGKAAYALPYYEGLGAGRGPGDGHLLIFTSEEKLLPAEDQDTARDLYRYDDGAGGQLECLTCDKDSSNFPVDLYDRVSFLSSNAAAIQRQRVASEDGSAIVFTSREQLLGDDANQANDVYLWRQGEGLSLVSAATGEAGVLDGSDGGIREQGAVISPDGKTVFFMTRATILPQDANNGAFDWYAARVGGGFPQAEDSGDPCEEVGELCQGVDPAPPTQPSPVASEANRAGGNVTKPKPCPKGKHRVKRPGGKTRCVSSKSRKAKKHREKHHDRASADRRASR